MRFLTTLLGLVTVLAGPLSASPPAEPEALIEAAQRQKKRKGKQRLPAYAALHTGDLESAQRLALEQNRPLLIAVVQEGEEANDRFYDQAYSSELFIGLSLTSILVTVNDGEHEAKTLKEKGEDGEVIERRVCSRFGTASCEHHRRNWNRVYQAYNINGQMKTPQLIVIRPNGKEKQRFIDQQSASSMAKAVNKLIESVGPGLSAAEVVEMKRQRGIAQAHAKGRAWPQALAAWQKALAITEHGTFADEARAGVDAALASMRKAIARALDMMERGEVIAGYLELQQLSADYEGTPVEKELAKTLKSAERNKEWRDAIRAHKRTLEAEELWKEVEKWLGQDQEAKAKKVAARILKRYGDTPAAKRARLEFPDLE